MNKLKERILFWSVVVSGLLLAACTSVKSVYLKNVVNTCMLDDKSKLLSNISIYIGCILGILIFELIRQLYTEKYRILKIKTQKEIIINKISHMPVKEFQSEAGQNYITILNDEIRMLVENHYIGLLDLVYNLVLFIANIAVLVYLNLQMAIIALVFTFLPIIVSSLQGKKIQKRTNKYVAANEKLNEMVGNLINGHLILKTNFANNDYENKLMDYNNNTAKKNYFESKTKVCINMESAFLSYFGEICLIVVGAFYIMKGTITVGDLLAVMQISEMLAIPTFNISGIVTNLNSVRGLKAKIKKISSIVPEDMDKKIKCPKIETIEFKNVSFKYDEKYILKNVNYVFEHGKKYLILGENGSGKSTLFKLMTKLEENYEGEILINGIDLKRFDDSFYNQLGIVLQTPLLLNGTFEENITLFSEKYSEDQITEILQSLEMERFLQNHDLKETYQDTKNNVSGGELQKLSLARVLLRTYKCILMDESTSSIDSKSSFQIEKFLLEDEDLTFINIEHKLIPDLISKYDAVLQIKNNSLQSSSEQF